MNTNRLDRKGGETMTTVWNMWVGESRDDVLGLRLVITYRTRAYARASAKAYRERTGRYATVRPAKVHEGRMQWPGDSSISA